ncbi:hypothetical protein D3C71_1866780 [compost metagenome]
MSCSYLCYQMIHRLPFYKSVVVNAANLWNIDAHGRFITMATDQEHDSTIFCGNVIEIKTEEKEYRVKIERLRSEREHK